MKALQWTLIACRLAAVACCLNVVSSGCGEPNTGTVTTPSAEEQQRDAETRKAMEAASQAAKKK
jgi:hypothetical protein